jgi:carbamoyl-phosphate synthase / aspartate carbamoyltransferase / dihydroorotase
LPAPATAGRCFPARGRGMTLIRLPGLVDVHTHMRDPGHTHKEDWSTGTAAAVAGGFTAVLAMPNTDPPVVDAPSLDVVSAAARGGARIDYGLFAGATDSNAGTVAALAPRVAGLKMYLDHTFGDLRLGDLDAWWRHLESWPGDRPVAVHAERASLGAVILMARLLGRPVHICHVSRRDEILLIRRAKEAGVDVTCEVAPHHLILSEDDGVAMPGSGAVRPPLARTEDRDALWEHLEVVDCFATDHAPHALEEKAAGASPPGFPGLETALPLLLTAVHQGRLSLDDLVARLATNPRRIFGLGEQPDTWVEVEADHRWVVRAASLHTRCDWTPFEGMEVRGRVARVVVRGDDAYRDGDVLAVPGSGRDMRESA